MDLTNAFTRKKKGSSGKTVVDFFRSPSNCPVTSYYWSGFSTVQSMVDEEWLRWRRPSHVPPKVALQMLPKQAVTSCES